MPKNTAKPGTLEARITALRDRHAEVDASIADEQTRPLPSISRLRLLKRRKLKLKDEMTYYEGVLRTTAHNVEERMG